MREMKDSGIKWVGEIPSHWNVGKVKHMFMPRSSKGNDTLILLSATQNRGMCPQSELEGVVKVAENTNLQNFKTVHINDFVISLRSFQGGFEISDYEGVCSPAYQVFYSTANIYHKYYKTLFKSRCFVDHINSLTVGIREGKNIQYDSFSYTLLPVPPISEQKTIAEFLDEKCAEIDELVGIEEQIIAELQAYKQAIITEAVTKGLDRKQNKNKNWTICGYKNIFSNIPSNSYQILQSEINATGKYPVVSQSAKYIEGYSDATCVLIHKNPYIIFGDHTKVVKYIDFDFIIGADGVKVIVPKINEKFAYYLLLHSVTLIEDRGYARHFSVLATLKFLIPPLTEQQAIAEYLDGRCEKIDSLIEVKQQKIAELKEYKKSVIYEYVTGKREII